MVKNCLHVAVVGMAIAIIQSDLTRIGRVTGIRDAARLSPQAERLLSLGPPPDSRLHPAWPPFSLPPLEAACFPPAGGLPLLVSVRNCVVAAQRGPGSSGLAAARGHSDFRKVANILAVATR